VRYAVTPSLTPLPSCVCLSFLDLSTNQLTGSIPSTVGLMTALMVSG
jgi:hypothetical protein